MTARIGRAYLSRIQQRGLGPSTMRLLPADLLMLMRRDGMDPVDRMAEVQATTPVSKVSLPFGMDAWIVTGYEESRAVLGAADAFSTDFAHLAANARVTAEQTPGGLGFSDPPVHTRLRRILTPEFTMRRLRRLAPRIDAIVEERLDAMDARQGPVDLVQEFALPIPSLTICELLGVAYEDRHDFQQLAMDRFDLAAGSRAPFGAMSASLAYFRDVVKKQRAEPGDGLLGMIVREHGDNVDDEELAGLADGVLTGGFETTASTLALGSLVLLRDEDLFRRIRTDGALTAPFVEEVLRYLTAVQIAFPRFARQDIEIAGQVIPRGDMVLCSLSGANRDPSYTADGGRFDPHRDTTGHLAFGYGIHRCIGAELARMELRAAYPALVRRFPHLRLAVPPQDLTFRKLSIVYGIESLPVHLR
ncbi:cytochrome P450 [Streptomyces sp. NBC_01387]|uniref:cytochrome P450 n=1 Tax=unclassified Streptomyces TaxID=2593676 RepID=UPI0020257145|nr:MULTISPECIES: cytochrome P450 [unclassified Streptomyces]MCX4552693.1 cytochrome P450 [Streptomyces sp. NBC_01500]WSC24033.1 cytochrome P450 [Streptomyces sp. NBC_01766]WSV57916.1 cytochrome P450 [Streptomyces sp. NBC_01014]